MWHEVYIVAGIFVSKDGPRQTRHKDGIISIQILLIYIFLHISCGHAYLGKFNIMMLRQSSFANVFN